MAVSNQLFHETPQNKVTLSCTDGISLSAAPLGKREQHFWEMWVSERERQVTQSVRGRVRGRGERLFYGAPPKRRLSSQSDVGRKLQTTQTWDTAAELGFVV